MSSPRPPIWTRTFVGAAIVNMLIATVFYLLFTIMALFAVDRFAASDSLAGFAASAFIVGAVLGRSGIGRFVDMLGRRRTLVVALLLYTVAALLYLVVQDLGMLIALRVLHGVGFGAGAQAVTTAAMDLIPRERRGEGTGYFSLATTFGTVAGPTIAVVVSQQWGFEALFALCSAVSGIGLGIAVFLRLPERELTPEEHATRWRMHFTDFFEPAVLRFSVITLIVGAGWASFGAYLNSYAHDAGLESSAGGFFLVFGLLLIASRLIMGRIQDRFGDNAALIPALLLFAAGLGMLAISPTEFTVLAAGALLGFGFGSFLPALQAVSVTVTAPHRVAVAISTFFLMLDLGVGVAPLLLGLMLPVVGYQGMYTTVALLVLACIAVYWGVHGRRAGVRTA